MTAPALSTVDRGLTLVPQVESVLCRRDPTFFASRHFYIPDDAPVGAPAPASAGLGRQCQLIQLQPHQESVLRFFFQRDSQQRFHFDTIVYSTPKKSGKTTVSGMIGRWASETWGQFGEVLYVGNDADQARERGFSAHSQSIQLTPGYQQKRRELPGRWSLRETSMKCLTTGTEAKAVATDYQGEAGANPIITIWEELWGFIHRDALRFWAEMAPSPTRLNSVRMVVTYAGYEGESELLWSLYDSTVKRGRQLRSRDLPSPRSGSIPFIEAPGPDDPVPVWVNDSGRIACYWDDGDIAHRMPWQQGDRGRQYYASESITQTPAQYDRLHRNLWTSGESEFVPIIWWDNCTKAPAPLTAGDDTPLVVSLDAAVSGDCFGLIIVSRDPSSPSDSVRVRHCQKWVPPPGGKLDYRQVEDVIRDFCSSYNVVEVCYDPYQLHDFCSRLRAEGVGNFREFSQGQPRLEADTALRQMIVHRRVHHSNEPDLRDHIQNSNAKLQKDEDSKMRLVKKAESRKIDLAVCLSMACYECLRLNL